MQHDVNPAEQQGEDEPDREDDGREVSRLRRWWATARSGDTAACTTLLRARVENRGRTWSRRRRRRRREEE